MKVALIFRGDVVRTGPANRNRMYVDALMCWDNWKKTLVEDLLGRGHTCETAFITYENEILIKIKEMINPKYIELHEKKTQRENFRNVIQFMKKHNAEYDRFIILRCDFRYRIPITSLQKWNETGIFLVNKDVHWPSQKLYSDAIFMVDASHVDLFQIAFKYDTRGRDYDDMHGLGSCLYENDISFHIIYDDYYHMTEHPMYAIASIETKEPDLEHPYLGNKIIDVSQWN